MNKIDNFNRFPSHLEYSKKPEEEKTQLNKFPNQTSWTEVIEILDRMPTSEFLLKGMLLVGGVAAAAYLGSSILSYQPPLVEESFSLGKDLIGLATIAGGYYVYKMRTSQNPTNLQKQFFSVKSQPENSILNKTEQTQLGSVNKLSWDKTIEQIKDKKIKRKQKETDCLYSKIQQRQKEEKADPKKEDSSKKLSSIDKAIPQKELSKAKEKSKWETVQNNLKKDFKKINDCLDKNLSNSKIEKKSPSSVIKIGKEDVKKKKVSKDFVKLLHDKRNQLEN